MTFARRERGLGRGGGGQVEARALIIREEEQLVLPDGTADGAAVLIPALARRGQAVEVVGPLVGVEEIVAQILEQVAVELVGARFQADVDHAAEKLAELRIRIVGDHAEFLDRVHVRRVGHIVIDELDVLHAVQQVVIGLLAIAVEVGPRRR